MQQSEVNHMETADGFESNESDSENDSIENEKGNCLQERIKIKEEHSKLISSLNSVTTHFAHVQFRLRQVIDAPLNQKETLLKDLEEFTFKGIPDFHSTSVKSPDNYNNIKDHLISQLQSQIQELEQSIKHLQKESEEKHVSEHPNIDNVNKTPVETNCSKPKPAGNMPVHSFSFFRKLLAILHIVNVHCNEEKDNFKRDILKKKLQVNHWGDIRAQLEVAISEIGLLAQEPDVPIDSDYMSDSEGSFYCNQKLASAVRRQLSPAIQNLMQHGLTTDSKSVSVVSGLTYMIGCVPRMGNYSHNKETMHPWELILKYYTLKNGDQFNSAPALKLSQSYNLEVAGSVTNSNTQKLLVTVGGITSSHSQFKRSNTAQFKAFVCAGLNAKLLINWLQLIYRCKPLIEMYYEPWSYALKTGFDDCCKSLEKLNHIHFNLPVDTAVHQLQNIKDAF